MRRLVGSLVVVLTATTAGACGSDEGEVSAQAERTLEPHVAEVRLAAGAGDASRLAKDLEELRVAVATLRAEGELSETGAAAILREADVVEQRSALITTTTRPPAVTPPENADEDTADRDGPRRKGGSKRGGDNDDD